MSEESKVGEGTRDPCVSVVGDLRMVIQWEDTGSQRKAAQGG